MLQFAKGLSDRQTADAVRGRIDWKYALGLELADPGFDFSVLCEFRARLVAGRLEQGLLDAMLARLRERGLLRRGGASARTAPTCWPRRAVNRLESVGETLRAALNAKRRRYQETACTISDTSKWRPLKSSLDRCFSRSAIALRIMASPDPEATKSTTTPDEPSTPEICDRPSTGASAVPARSVDARRSERRCPSGRATTIGGTARRVQRH